MDRWRPLPRALLPCLIVSVAATLLVGANAVSATELGIEGTRFTIDKAPTFLYGISYYGALGADDEVIRADLDHMQQARFNWIRVWATWAAYENEISAVDAEGKAREPYFGRLRDLIADCDRRGMVVDVTLARGNGQKGSPNLWGLEPHKAAVKTLLEGLREYRNWYLDLANERNIRDNRFTSSADLRVLRGLAKSIDPARLITASHGGDIDDEQLRKYLQFSEVDFISPHRPRNAASPAQTADRTRDYLRRMGELGRVIPVHYQEPFRRDYGRRQPEADDFVTDLKGALAGGAAGWCLHNGANRHNDDGRPRRCSTTWMAPNAPRSSE